MYPIIQAYEGVSILFAARNPIPVNQPAAHPKLFHGLSRQKDILQ